MKTHIVLTVSSRSKSPGASGCVKRGAKGIFAIFLFGIFFLGGMSAQAQTHSVNGDWNVNASGNWSTTANWTNLDGGADYPSAIDGVVKFLFNISTTRTITLDVDATVGSMIVGDPSGGSAYTITGSKTLTFDVSSGVAALQMNDGGGNFTIDTAIQLNDELDVSVFDTSNNQGIILSNIISGGTNGTTTILFDDFSTGTQSVNWLLLNDANTFQGQLIANSGLIRLEGSNSVAGAVGVGNETIARNGGSIDLRDRDFNINGVNDTEMFLIEGAGTNGLGALRNTSGTATISYLQLTGDATVGGYSRTDINRHTDASANDVAAVVDLGNHFLTKLGNTYDFVIHNADIRNRAGGGFNIYEGELRFENNGALSQGGTIDGTTYGNNLDGVVINLAYNRNAYDGSDPTIGSRTSDPWNVNVAQSLFSGNPIADARLSFGNYWGTLPLNTKVTDSWNNFTVNINNGIWQREGYSGTAQTGQTFDQIFGPNVTINFVGGGMGRDANGSGNVFDFTGGSGNYNSTNAAYDHPGVTEFQGVLDNTTGGNAGTGFTKRGNRELRLTGDSSATFDGDVYVAQNTGRYMALGYNTSNGAPESQYFSMSLAGASGSLAGADTITVSRWGSLALLNNSANLVYASANNDNRLNDAGFLNLRNGHLLLETDTATANHENFGNVVADFGSNYFFLDTRAGGQFDGSFQTFTTNNGGVLKIMDMNGAHTFGIGAGEDRIKLNDATGLNMIGANNPGGTDQRVVLGLFGGVLPASFAARTGSGTTRSDYNMQNAYAYGGSGIGLMTLDSGYLRPLTAAEYSTDILPTAGTNWRVDGYISPAGEGSSGRTNYAGRNVTSDIAVNSLTIAFDATSSGQVLPTGSRDIIIIEQGRTLTINSGILNAVSFAEATTANLDTVIRGGSIDFNGGRAYLNAAASWNNLDDGSNSWSTYLAGNSLYIRSHLVNITDFVKTGRNSLVLNTWNEISGNIYNSEQSSIYVEHPGALGAGAAGREIQIGGYSSLLLDYGTNVSGIDVRVTNSLAGTIYALRTEGAYHATWGGNVILDYADASNNAFGIYSIITARNNGTLSIYGNIYTANNGNYTDSDLYNDPPIISTSFYEAYTVNLRGQVRDVATGNLATDPLNAAITSLYRTGDSATRLDPNHSLRFIMTGHDEGNVNAFQQWDATGRLDLDRGYFRLLYDPAAAGNDGTGFLTDSADALIQGNDYWTRATLGPDGSGTGTYHSHLMLTKADQVFNWGNYLYVYNNNRDGTLSIGNEAESGTAYIGSNNSAGYSIIFENQGGDRDLRFLQTRGGTLSVQARLYDNGTAVNSSVSVIGPGTIRFDANSHGASTVERWNFMGGEAIWAPRTSDGSLLGDNRFAISTAQAMFGGGKLSLLGETGTNRSFSLTGNVHVLNGDSVIRLNAPSGRTVSLNFGATTATLTKDQGGTLTFVEEGPGTANITLQATGLTGAGIMSWAAYGTAVGEASDFASNGTGGAISAFTGYTAGAAETDFIAGNTVDVSTDVAFTAAAAPDNLRFNTAADLSLDTQSMTLNQGGLLITTANTGANSISGGTLTSGFDADLGDSGTSRDLMIFNYGSGGLTLGATLTDFGADRLNLVLSGPGTTTLTAANTNTGDIYLNNGVLSISSDSNLGDINGSIARISRVSNAGASSGASAYSSLSGAAISFVTNNAPVTVATGTFNSNLYISTTALTDGGSGYTTGVYLDLDDLSKTTENKGGVWAILDSGNLHFNGGTLKTTADVTLDGGRTLFLGANGATLNVTEGTTLTINGYITSEQSQISSANGYTANQVGAADEQASNRNPDIGDLIIQGGGTVTLTGAPDNTSARANMYNSYGGITWINEGVLRIASAGSTAGGILGTQRSFVDGTIIGAAGTLMFDTTSDPYIYEWFTTRGKGYHGMGTFAAVGATARTFRLNGQNNFESDVLFNMRNGSAFRLNESGGTTFGSGDIYKLGTGTFYFYTNAPEWKGAYYSSASTTVLYGTSSLGGMTGMYLDRQSYLGNGASSTSIDEFRNRLPDTLPIFTDGYVRLRMEASGGIYSGIEKVGVLTAVDGQTNIEYDMGADLIGGAARLQGDYVGWHFGEIVRNPGSVVKVRAFDYGVSFADKDFNAAIASPNNANRAVLQVDTLPTLVGAGDGSNGDAPVIVGFFGGVRPGWINVAGTGQIFGEDYVASSLMTVDTNTAGEHFLRPLTDSEFKVISSPDTATTTSIVLEDQGVSAEQNLKIVGVITDTGIGAGELTSRYNSILTLGSLTPECDQPAGINLTVNSLTFASESFVLDTGTGTGSRYGNWTVLDLEENATLRINSGMVNLFNTGVLNRGGIVQNYDVNMYAMTSINGGLLDFNGKEAIFNIGGVWAHYNTTDAVNAYRGADSSNAYLQFNTSITNATNLIKTGGNSLTMNAPNYYTGDTYVNYGALYARHDLALGQSTKVDVSGYGTFVIGLGARISGVDLYVGKIASNNTALQIENNSVWAGNVIIDNVDNAGGTSYARNFTPRIFSNTTGLATIEGNIYGGTTPLAQGATDSRMFSTYSGAYGLFNITGQVRDTAAGAITGPIDWSNQASVLRMEVTANNNESAVQLTQQYDAAGRINLVRGALYYAGTGDFYTAAAAATVNANFANSMIGLQMGGRSVTSDYGRGSANLGFFLLNSGTTFNLSSWGVGVDLEDPDNFAGNGLYGEGNTTGNSTIGGVNTSGSVNFGTGAGAITFTQGTTSYTRDLRLSAVNGGTVNINAALVDGGNNVISSITKIGGGEVHLKGSSYGDSTVEGVNVLGGFLFMDNYGTYANRRVGNGAYLTLAGGWLIMDGSAASFTENFGTLTLKQGGSAIAALGNGTVDISTSSISRAAGGTLHLQSIGGGIIHFSDAAMQNVARIGSYATYGANAAPTPFATDWAATDAAGNVIAYTGYGVDTFGAGVNTDVTLAAQVAATTNSVRFNAAAGSIGSGALTLDDGGILITSNYTGGTPVAAGVTVTTAAASTDLLIHNFATGTVNFDGTITGAQKVVIGGSGTLAFNAGVVTSNLAQSSTTGTNTTLTVTDSSVLTAGMEVSGTYIPVGTKIVSITDATHVVLTHVPTGSATNSLTFTTRTITPVNTYTGETSVVGGATLAFNAIEGLGNTSGLYLNGGTLSFTGDYTATPFTKSGILGSGNGIINVSDAAGRLVLRSSSTNQFSSESNNIIAAYGTNNPNSGGLIYTGAGTVQFGDRSAAAATQDLLGVQSNYTGLTIVGDGTNAIHLDIQGQGNDNAQYTVFGTTESWADATILRNNTTIEFSMKRGDTSRDAQIRFREWFQIGEQAGDQILFDGSTGRQPTLDGMLNIIGDLTFQTQGNRYGDSGSTYNADFLINPNEGGITGSGKIIKLGDGNVRFYTSLAEWTGDLDVQDGYLALYQTQGNVFNPTGTVYLGDPNATQTTTIVLGFENRWYGNGSTSIDAPRYDFTFNRDIVVRDGLKQSVYLRTAYMPAGATVHYTNSINVGNGSTGTYPVLFYVYDYKGLDPSLVGHGEHYLFDISGNISGSNNIFVQTDEDGGANDDFDIDLTVLLRGDNSAWTGTLTIGLDTNTTIDYDERRSVRLGSLLGLGTNQVNMRNGGFLELGGLSRTFTQNLLFTGGSGMAYSAGLVNASDTAATVTFDSGTQSGVTYQDIGVGLKDGAASVLFGSGNAALSVIKIGSGDTVFGASTGGGAEVDTFSNYTGDTQVQAGKLIAGSNNSFSPFSRFIVSAGATLSPNWANAGTGFDVTIGSLVGVAGSAADIDNGAIFHVGGDNTTGADFAGVISGAGSFDKMGGGSQTLSGTNTFTGDVTVTQGTLIGANNAAFGDAMNTISLGGIAFAATHPLDAQVGLLLAGTANNVVNPVTMNNFDGNDEGITLIGTQESSGTYGFGVGGTVALYQDMATRVYFEADGTSTFQFGDVVSDGGSAAVTSLTKIGTGTVELHVANNYGSTGTWAAGAGIDGGTVVRHGALSVFDNDALSNTIVELGDTRTDLTAADWATTRSLLTSTTTTFDPASDGAGGAGNGAFLKVSSTIDGVVLGTGDVGKRILVKNESTHPERNGVYVVVSVDTTCNEMNLVRATDFDAAGEMNYGSSIAVTGGNTQAGTRYFMGSQDVATVNNDSMKTDPVHWLVDHDNPDVSLLAGASSLTIANGIDVNDTNGTGSTTLGGTFATGASYFTGNVTLQHSTLPGVDNVREVKFTSASNDNSGTPGEDGVIFSGVISEDQAGDTLSVNKVGAGTVTFTGANTYTGKTTVTQGTLAVSGSGSIDNTSWIEVNNGASLDLSDSAGGDFTYDGPISGAGTLVSPTGQKIIIGTDGGAGTLSPGMSSDPSSVATAGDQIGVLTVNGNLELAADTTGVTRLTLQMGAASGADLNDASNIITHLGAGDYTTWVQTQGAAYDSNTGGNHDRLVVNGDFSMNAGAHIQFTSTPSDYQPVIGDVFNLIDWTTVSVNGFNNGGGSGFRAGGLINDLGLPDLSSLPGGLLWDTSLFNNYGIVVVVPEPGRASLLLAGLALLIFRRRRRWLF